MQYRELVMTKHVAIIGAGASGIICAKKFLDAGFNVTIFEKVITQLEFGISVTLEWYMTV